MKIRDDLPDDLLPAAEAALRAGVTRETLIRAAQRGELPALTRFGRWWLRPSQVDAWRAAREVPRGAA